VPQGGTRAREAARTGATDLRQDFMARKTCSKSSPRAVRAQASASESLLASLDEVLSSGLVLAERLGAMTGMGTRRGHPRTRTRTHPHPPTHPPAHPL
jgi:hypothetical protein